MIPKSKFFLVLVLLFAMISCDNQTYKQGRLVYERNCMNCHMEHGEGFQNLIPALKDSKILDNDQELICLIRNGIDTKGSEEKVQPMPGNDKLTPTALSNLINYLRHEYDIKPTVLLPKEVEHYLNDCNK